MVEPGSRTEQPLSLGYIYMSREVKRVYVLNTPSDMIHVELDNEQEAYPLKKPSAVGEIEGVGL